MASIRKRKFGSDKEAWIVDYRDQHGERHVKTFPNKKAAEAWKVNALHEVQQGIHTAASASKTVEEAWRLWLADCEANNLGNGGSSARKANATSLFRTHVAISKRCRTFTHGVGCRFNSNAGSPPMAKPAMASTCCGTPLPAYSSNTSAGRRNDCRPSWATPQSP